MKLLRTTGVRKRCVRCGHVATTTNWHCRQRKFGLGSYACWGKLVKIGLTEKLISNEEVLADMKARIGKRPQDVAQKKLEHARKMVIEKTTAMKRIVTSLRMWETRASRYAKRASMTDAEVETERQARKVRADAKPKRRGIKLEGSL